MRMQPLNAQLAALPRQALSKAATELLGELDDWISKPPYASVPGQVALWPGDDYGSELVLTVQPDHGCCNVEVGIVPPGPSHYWFSIGSWRCLSEAFQLRRPSREHAAMYHEPHTPLRARFVSTLLKSVMDGRAFLYIGTIGARLVATNGFVDLPEGRFVPSGVGDMWLARLGRLLRAGSVRQYACPPWRPEGEPTASR